MKIDIYWYETKLLLLFLAGKAVRWELAGKTSFSWVVLAGKKHPLNESWVATLHRYLVLAGCEERVLFSHGS